MRLPNSYGLLTLLEGISNTTAERPQGGTTISSEVERAVETHGLEAMFTLAMDPQTSSQARAIASFHLEEVLKKLSAEPTPADSDEAIHHRALIERIQEFQRSPEKFTPAKPIEAPPGMPIGDEEVM